MTARIRVGVLAIQGDVAAHARALARAGAEAVEVRVEKDLDGLGALVLPGGESTTISKGMTRLGLYEPIRGFARAGHPVLGTCAGAILLARQVENGAVSTLALLDVTAIRNAYGTQVDSFAAPADAGAAEGFEGLRCIFIRAPRLAQLGPGV
ncbi:MAG: pyridoxal 5'-phosphate synthase glutaminase subunit PdxT, partial [Deltaproteobacteria bacterium]|nr:pyridoxal 5'-phosphate synthase glutaminase subunit PdxT [Deltaproteobacteria bacterium]